MTLNIPPFSFVFSVAATSPMPFEGGARNPFLFPFRFPFRQRGRRQSAIERYSVLLQWLGPSPLSDTFRNRRLSPLGCRNAADRDSIESKIFGKSLPQ